MRFEFVVRTGRETGRQIALPLGLCLTFGRMKTCDVQVEDESVSRRHCTVEAKDSHCVVTDLQSANGTFVNEQRVTSAAVRPLDQLRIGGTVFDVVSASE